MEYVIRPATLGDIDFIILTIIQAEKSGTDRFGLATIFNLSESEIKIHLNNILAEEIDGCELSLSSFLVAEHDGVCVAAVGGWKEGDNEDGLSSAMLKSNLIGFHFPPQKLAFAKGKVEIIKDLQIDRIWGTYQIEYVFVDKNHRGNNLAGKLIDAHIQNAKECPSCYVQVFGDNNAAISIYKKMGFEIEKAFMSKNEKVGFYLPYFQKLLMKKKLQ